MNNVRCLNDLFHFSARDEYKIKYEQMERDVLLLNERVWQKKNVPIYFLWQNFSGRGICSLLLNLNVFVFEE